MAILSPAQTRMLRLVVERGYCFEFIPARHRSAWGVRMQRGAVEMFAQTTGDALVRMGFLVRDKDVRGSGPNDKVLRRYVVTKAGRAHVNRRKSRE